MTKIENGLENNFLFLRNVKMLGVIVIKYPDVQEIITMMFLLGWSGRNHETVQKT